MKKQGGLRRRWFLNTALVVSVLGLVCVLALTAYAYVSLYANARDDLHDRAVDTASVLSQAAQGSTEQCRRLCAAYAAENRSGRGLELQFFDPQGNILVSSWGPWAGSSPQTGDISQAVAQKTPQIFQGEDPDTGERVLSACAPVISQGKTVGFVRYVTATGAFDLQVVKAAALCLVIALGVIALVLTTSNFYLRSVMEPISQISEKAKRIASGSYGAQIPGRYPDEIGELADNINEMSAKISQNEKMQTEFISSLSHELRTPLTVITGWSETLLSSETLDTDTRRGVNIILRESRRLNEMVIDLLDFTRMQDGRMTLNVEEADLRSEFEDTVFMYGSRLSQDGLTLNYLENDQDIPPIPCDAKRMRQVFLNILDNAAKHGGEGKKIDASIHYENHAVVIRIRDYGCGIPEDEIPLVKKKFYKGSSKARGSGIGLAVSDEIVQLHGGTLELENAPGGGTLVTVTLPDTQ